MRLQTRLIVAAASVLLGSETAHAQVNGNATIKGEAFGQELSVSTSSQFAGAVSSIKWGNKEYINNWDHGRQLQLDSQFFNRYICYNPYEAGSFEDGQKSTSSSKLLSLSAGGNQLKATTQMAWYYGQFIPENQVKPEDYCGDPAQWLPITPYKSPLSDYKVTKTITIGFAGIPNVIEDLVEQVVPEHVRMASNVLVAVVNYEFSSLRSWDVISKDYRNIRSIAGIDDRIKVVSTPDGNHAMGWYAPELLQPYGLDGVANWWLVVPPNPFYTDPANPGQPDPNFACVHFGSANRYDNFGPGTTYDRAYLVVGNLEQVRTALSSVHLQFKSLDPDVFNWREYVALNGLGSLTTQQAAQNHWITQGIAQGLTASKTFSASQYLQLNPDVGGVTDYQTAIDHYVAAGRAEGRSTVAKTAAGMQHLLVFGNRTVNSSGQNVFGQLGTSSPPHIASLDNSVTEIAAGDYTSFAVKTDGTLWVWGSNQYGAHGDGSSGDNLTSPVQVPIPARITTPSRRGRHAIAVGAGVYAAIDSDGQVWTWGVNWNGRLGDGTTDSRYIPSRVKVSANPNDYLTGIVSISAGAGTIAALDADGAVWTWGAGADGALGNASTADSPYAVQVVQGAANNATSPLAGMEQVACGSSGFCIALARYGAVFGWGNNSFSQLALPAGGALSIASLIGFPTQSPIDGIAAGSAHCIAHSQDGNVYGWGYNGRGQLGIGSSNVAVSSPVAMSAGPDGMNNISDLAAGGNVSIMIRNSDRAVFVAGDNQSGQLGLAGNPPVQQLPVRSPY
jgi:Regulator of chromosome condensation (RCC1) repeat